MQIVVLAFRIMIYLAPPRRAGSHRVNLKKQKTF
jgi:hypothetical protein